MYKSFLIIITLLFLVINSAQAKYYILNDEGEQVGVFNKLKIEKDDFNRFS